MPNPNQGIAASVGGPREGGLGLLWAAARRDDGDPPTLSNGAPTLTRDPDSGHVRLPSLSELYPLEPDSAAPGRSGAATPTGGASGVGGGVGGVGGGVGGGWLGETLVVRLGGGGDEGGGDAYAEWEWAGHADPPSLRGPTHSLRLRLLSAAGEGGGEGDDVGEEEEEEYEGEEDDDDDDDEDDDDGGDGDDDDDGDVLKGEGERGGSWSAMWSPPSTSAAGGALSAPLERGSAHELPLTQVRYAYPYSYPYPYPYPYHYLYPEPNPKPKLQPQPQPQPQP